MLVFACKPEDFVVVKLDIDTPAIEQTIIAVLAQRPDLAALIDELFFEYHFDFDGFDFGWGTIECKGRRRHRDRHDVQASLAWHPRALLDLKSRACKRVHSLLPGELCRHVRDPSILRRASDRRWILIHRLYPLGVGRVEFGVFRLVVCFLFR